MSDSVVIAGLVAQQHLKICVLDARFWRRRHLQTLHSTYAT